MTTELGQALMQSRLILYIFVREISHGWVKSTFINVLLLFILDLLKVEGKLHVTLVLEEVVRLSGAARFPRSHVAITRKVFLCNFTSSHEMHYLTDDRHEVTLAK